MPIKNNKKQKISQQKFKKITVGIEGRVEINRDIYSSQSIEPQPEQESMPTESPLDLGSAPEDSFTLDANDNATSTDEVNIDNEGLLNRALLETDPDKIVEHLNGIDVNLQPNQDKLNQILSAAVDNGHVDVVTKSLEKGADVNVQNEAGETLAHLAVKKNQEEILRLLIDAGVDVNIASNSGGLALTIAAIKKKANLVTMLLDAGADINCTNSDGKTALAWAIRRNVEDIVRILLDRGADINALNAGGETAITFAAQHSDANIISILYEHGCDLDQANENGETALFLALSNDQMENLSRLIELGSTNQGDTNLASYAEDNMLEDAIAILSAAGFMDAVTVSYESTSPRDFTNSAVNAYRSKMRRNVEVQRNENITDQIKDTLSEFRLFVKFAGETGIDQGGLTRDFLSRLNSEMPQYFTDIFLDDDHATSLLDFSRLLGRDGIRDQSKIQSSKEKANLLGLIFWHMVHNETPVDSVTFSDNFFKKLNIWSAEHLEGDFTQVADELNETTVSDIDELVNKYWPSINPQAYEHYQEYGKDVYKEVMGIESDEDLLNSIKSEILDQELFFMVSKRLNFLMEAAKNYSDDKDEQVQFLKDVISPNVSLREVLYDQATQQVNRLQFSSAVGQVEKGYITRYIQELCTQDSEEAEEKLKKIVTAFGGMSSLPAGENLTFNARMESAAPGFHFHTCFFSVDIPRAEGIINIPQQGAKDLSTFEGYRDAFEYNVNLALSLGAINE